VEPCQFFDIAWRWRNSAVSDLLRVTNGALCSDL